MLAHPKVELSIVIEGPQLIFKLCNNKPNSNLQEHQSNKGGIGLKNTAKRLQLLYPDKHNLKIEATDTSFFIYMSITLKEMKEVNFKKFPISPAQPTPLYASP
jgi:LytS/YehU family sensor histidine kinase